MEAKHTPGPWTIGQADAVIAAVAEMRGGAEVGYRTLTQSSQWDTGFDYEGRAFVAYLHRAGRTLVEDNPHGPGVLPLAGVYDWCHEQARIRLAQSLSTLYGLDNDRAAIANATRSAA